MKNLAVTLLTSLALLTSCTKDTDLAPLPYTQNNETCGILIETYYGWSNERGTSGYTYTLETPSGNIIKSWSPEFKGLQGTQGCMVLDNTNMYVFVPTENQL